MIGLGRADKRVYHADCAIKPIVLKILGKDFRQAVMFGV